MRDGEGHNIEQDSYTHARYASVASTTTLDGDGDLEDPEPHDEDEDELGRLDDKVDPENSGSNKPQQSNNGTAQARPHANADKRPKLVPKRQHECRLRPASLKSKLDYVSEIVMEQPTEDYPLPNGYIGTWRGIRFVQPSLKLFGSCGIEPHLHKLTCGHWISSPLPCGRNCHTPIVTNEPFPCTECHDLVADILNTKLTPTEKQKLAHAKTGYHTFYIALAVEYVTKHAHPHTSGNLTETVIDILSTNNTTNHPLQPSQGPVEPPRISLAQSLRDLQALHARKDFETQNPLVHHTKRPCPEELVEDSTLLDHGHALKKHKPCGGKTVSVEAGMHDIKRKRVTTDVDGPPASRAKRAKVRTALHDGAKRSPYFSRSVGAVTGKRGAGSGDDGLGKRRCVLDARCGEEG